jgi:Family of unknown function (DUF5709)
VQGVHGLDVPAAEEEAMIERRHESEDLEDYEVLDSSDTLDGPPGDDPLDRGVVTPERWSVPIRSGGTAAEQEAGESLDELLAEEEPDVGAAGYGDEFEDPDENAPDDDVRRALRDDGPDPRAGRLVAEDVEYDENLDVGESVGYDVGIDSGAATAEEAAVHTLGDEDSDSSDWQS